MGSARQEEDMGLRPEENDKGAGADLDCCGCIVDWSRWVRSRLGALGEEALGMVGGILGWRALCPVCKSMCGLIDDKPSQKCVLQWLFFDFKVERLAHEAAA